MSSTAISVSVQMKYADLLWFAIVVFPIMIFFPTLWLAKMLFLLGVISPPTALASAV